MTLRGRDQRPQFPPPTPTPFPLPCFAAKFVALIVHPPLQETLAGGPSRQRTGVTASSRIWIPKSCAFNVPPNTEN